jgi:bacterioferritin
VPCAHAALSYKAQRRHPAALGQSGYQNEIHTKGNRMNANAPASADTSYKLELDEEAIERARSSIEDGAVTRGADPWREQIIKLLQGALATELVCVLRYKRHHFTAKGLAAPAVADEFMEHAREETVHSESIAQRIVQLGGEPNFNPATLLENSHAGYDESTELLAMIRSNLVAERVAVEAYTQMVEMIGDKDPTTRRMLVEILRQEEEHADELSDLLAQSSRG